MRESSEWKANPSVVFDLTDELRRAWETILNTYPHQKGHQPIDYMDALMAVHNFHKLVILHVLEESQANDAQRLFLWSVMRDTFVDAVELEIQWVYARVGQAPQK